MPIGRCNANNKIHSSMAVLPSHQRAQHGQIGVFVAYGSRLGHALLDRELYRPEEWANV